MPSFTPAQIRAARAMTDMSQRQLAKLVGISANALVAIEKGRSDPRSSTLQKIIHLLEAGGIEFTDDGGVRPRARP
jgi:DNA-binding XRE family transcriptional regulator